eukprot:UN23345
MRELMSDLRPDNLRFFHRTLHTEHLKKVEYLFICLIAVVCGLVGVLYIRCMKWWRMFQDSTRNHISPYLLVIVNTGLFLSSPTSLANIASAPLESSSLTFLESPLFTNVPIPVQPVISKIGAKRQI